MRTMFLLMCCTIVLAGCGQTSDDAATSQDANTFAAVPMTTPNAVVAPAPNADMSSDAESNDGDAADDTVADTPHTDTQLTPLSKDDIALYLQVMHAAADRVQHPAAADIALLARYKTLLAAADSSKAAMPSPADSIAMADATMLKLQMDMLIVRERHIDEQRYTGIASVIDDVVPNPTMYVAGGARGEGFPVDVPEQSSASIALSQKIKNAEAQDATILAPYRAEIQQLLSVVRNLHSLQ